MSHSVTVTPVVGLPSLTGWAQVVRNQSGNLICVYAIKTASAHNLGRDLADFITHSQPTDAVTLHQFLLDLLAKCRRAEAELQVASVLVQADQVFLSAYQGQILYRSPQGNVKTLLTTQGEPQLIEGRFRPGATIVALTQSAQIQTQNILQLLEKTADTDIVITTVLPEIHADPNSALAALAFIQPEANFTTSPLASPPLTRSRITPQLGWTALRQLSQAGSFLRLVGQAGFKTSKTLFFKLKTRYQSTQARQKRQIWLSLAIVGLIIVGLGLGGWWIWQRTQSQLTALDQKTDPLAAREMATQAVTELKKLAETQTKFPAGATRVNQNLLTAEQYASHISGLSELQTLAIFFDLRLTESNFLASKILIQGTIAYFVDLERKQLIALDLSKKQSQILPIGTIDKLTDFTVLNQKLYWLGEGISNWPLGEGQKTIVSLKAAGDSDREATQLAGFGNYLYVLNPIKRNIFRYALNSPAANQTTATKSGTPSTKTASTKISEPVGWLTNKKNLEFETITSLAIDGDIWLTQPVGQILKFTQGQPANWSPIGLKTPFSSSLNLVTNSELTKLYVLEPSQQRLVILEKSGQFFKELKSPTLATVTTFGVSETLKKAFLVSGSVVYELPI